MKKLFTTLLTIVTIVMASSAFAMVKEHQATLGGVSQNMSIEQVEAALGKNYTRTKLAKNRYSLIFANGFYVEMTGNMVTYMEVDRNNGVATYDGLHVGSTMGQVEDALGRADHQEGNFHIYRASGQKDIAFIYNGDKVGAIYSGISFEDEEKIRKEEENKSRAKNRIDVGDEIVIRTRQAREIYWNLRDIFHHHRYRGYRW